MFEDNILAVKEQGKTKKNRSFYISVAIMIFVLFVIISVVFYIFVVNTVTNIYEDEYNEKTLDINKFIVNQVDGDEVQHFAETGEKTEDYYKALDTLRKLRDTFGADFIYILMDDGDDETYTYLFDIYENDGSKDYENAGYGKTDPKSLFPGSKEVLNQGIAFGRAIRYNVGDTDVYYAYAPIKNSDGEVVAFLGVDLDASPMVDSLNEFRYGMILLCVGSLFLFLIIIILYGKFYISAPLVTLTGDIKKLSGGNFDISYSSSFMERRDEFGEIYRTFYDFKVKVAGLIDKMVDLSIQAGKGNLSARMTGDEDVYSGKYRTFIDESNEMLDTIHNVLNIIPNKIIFYDTDFNELYRNEPPGVSYRMDPDDEKLGKIDVSYTNYNEILDRNMGEIKSIYEKFVLSREGTFTKTITFDTDGDGSDKVHFNMFFAKNGESDNAGVCVVFTDVTEFMEMSEAADASNRAKSEFLSKMSHEIRTPMNAIIGMTEIAKRQNIDKKMRQTLTNIELSTKHLLTIINDVLDISKIEYGNFSLQYESVNLKNTMTEITKILQINAGKRDLAINLHIEDLSDEELYIRMDDARLRQVILNLLSNAIKFSDEGSKIDITLKKIPSETLGFTRILFSVRDYGRGVNEKDIDKIFEAFEQSKSNVVRIHGGTGLGLPISNSIVKQMGSEGIKVDSEPGKGSNFWFELEIENVSPDSVEEIYDHEGNLLNKDTEIAEGSLAGKRILIVDDIDINREVVMSLIENTGVETDEASDGSFAVEKFQSAEPGHYDLILMDIQMVEVDGYQATDAIRNSGRADGKTIPIIAMSANAFKEDVEKALSAGMDGYLTKPIDYGDLIETLKKYLSK